MKVSELINYLKRLPEDYDVAYHLHSEQCLLELKDMSIEEHCIARDDGWIADKRPDKPFKKYFLIS